MRATRQAAGISCVALVASLGILSASGAIALEPDAAAEILIGETDNGFAFSDAVTGARIQAPQARQVLDGDRSTLGFTSSGVPVIINELYALPDAADPEAAYAESVARASEEQDPAEFTLPEGESAYAEETFSAEETAFDPALLRPRAAFAVTPTSVTFDLSHKASYEQKEYEHYTVYSNEELLGCFDTPEFTVNGLQPSTRYSLDVVSSNVDPESGEVAADGYLATAKRIELQTPALTKAEAEQQQAQNLGRAAGNGQSQGYLHTTFIPDARVTLNPNFNFGCGGYPFQALQFSGDNRTWEVPGKNAPWQMASYRTYMYLQVAFDYPADRRVMMFKNVSPTTKYVNGQADSTLTASSDGARVTSVSASSSYAQAVLDHSVKNPHCSAGAITYHDETRFYRNSNTIEVVGWRYPVPNHEISFRYSISSNPGSYAISVLRRQNEGFHCLLGYCQRDDYAASR